MGYLFEWDPKKAVANQRKHGVSFAEATTVFADPRSLVMHDPDHSDAEERYLLLGMSHKGRLMVVSYVDRPPRTRLISARRATRSERRKYEAEA